MTDERVWLEVFCASVTCTDTQWKGCLNDADEAVKAFRERFPKVEKTEEDLDTAPDSTLPPELRDKGLKRVKLTESAKPSPMTAQEAQMAISKPQVPPDASEVVKQAMNFANTAIGRVLPMELSGAMLKLRDALTDYHCEARAAPKPVAARHWEVEHCKVIEVLEGGSRSLTYIAIDTLEAAKMVVILNRVYAMGQADGGAK